jgi:hypothetical protein
MMRPVQILFVSAVFTLTPWPGQARASQELRDEMAKLARAVLGNTKNQPVTVGQFSPTGLPDSNAGLGIEQILAAALEAANRGSVRGDARYEVKGDYALVQSRTNNALKELRITARLIEKATGEEVTDLRVAVNLNGNNTIAEIVQLTAALPPAGSKEERNQEIQRRVQQPSVFIRGEQKTLISSQKDSPYAVELLVKPLRDSDRHAQPRQAREENGKAFVDIQRDELYEVRIHNNSSREVAVSLTVDGLDVFHFSKDRSEKGQPRFTHFIVAPKGSRENPEGALTIVGWHNTIDPQARDNFLSFLVTAHGQGAVSKAGLPSRGKVGVLHVQFSHCTQLPPGSKSRSGNETGFGPPREVKQQAVRYEIEPPHDFVSVRYTR